ncbi:MAG: hypothetical protein KF866_04515 [Phycisphaeraceae bacterium]|nr:hypothetical protein [Phycisphaeraceae bacterium]
MSADSVVVDCEIRASQNNNVAIRQVGSGVQEADAAQLSNTLQRLSGVDLSEIEVSTPSATPLTVHVIGFSRR